MKLYFPLCAFLLALSLIGKSQSTLDQSKLNSYLDALEANDKFMGSVALRKNGELIYTRAIGYADFEKQQKASAASKYRIGSISKTFTAVMIMKAVESKQLDLDQSINKWFPSIENSKKITVRSLLQHRSGLHNFTSDPEYFSWNTQAKTEAEMLDIINKKGSDFKPDSKAEYSNSNYVLLTYILEKTYGKTYAQLLQELIATPAGLSSTSVFGPINPSQNECLSYTFEGEWKLQPETHFTIPLGAGCILSTPSDLTTFAEALFQGHLIRPESLKEMQNIKEGYGLGLFQVPFYEHAGFGHTGGIDGFTSVFAYFPEDSLSFSITSNGGSYDMNKVAIALLSAYFNKSYDIPEFTTYSTTAEELEQYVGVYTSTEIKLDITFTKEGNTLFAQATGQPTIALSPIAKDKFQFEQADAIFEFDLPNKTMFLLQAGAQIKFQLK